MVGGQRHTPTSLPPGKRPDTQCTGGWVSPRAGLEESWESGLHRDSTPEPSSPDQNPNHTLRNNTDCSHENESLPENNFNTFFPFKHLSFLKLWSSNLALLSDYKSLFTQHTLTMWPSIQDPDGDQLIGRLLWLNKKQRKYTMLKVTHWNFCPAWM